MAADSPDDDAGLVARCRSGDEAAWGVLVHRYQRLVWAVARSTGLDDHAAADVFQTVFARLVRSLPTLTHPDRLRAWIVTTAKREGWLQQRRARRLQPLSGNFDNPDGDEIEPDIADDTPSGEQALADLQQLHLLRTALDHLDPRCRTLLGLLFADDDEVRPYEQIARALGIPVGSIGPTRARCLAKLRMLLREAE